LVRQSVLLSIPYRDRSPKSPVFCAVARMKLGVEIRRSGKIPHLSPASL
jgi:hypothetical protein